MKTTGARRRDGAKPPEWASGLRRLYDSVVDEPLPDSFARLLDQLDEKEAKYYMQELKNICEEDI